ncbi:uncharacterized protein METZ01_LOCUS440514 [marine metagenome]|uniref:Uncharacterized protein n=1 Tax=marine metagenome TaxID=408172 RepID=A0A382YX31_9ZZZZ
MMKATAGFLTVVKPLIGIPVGPEIGTQ